MEKFAVDLDAVLDEFELNEDQAEVAAARLQKQIEQGRLEIASSDTTPGSSYANSPRASFAHLHEEPGRTISPLARPAAGIEPTTAAATILTPTNHRTPADPPTNHRAPADPPTNHRAPVEPAASYSRSLSEALVNHEPKSAVSANYYTAPAYPVASVPDVVVASGSAPSSSSSSNTESPEHYPIPSGPVNGDRKSQITTDIEHSTIRVADLSEPSPNGPESNQITVASSVPGQGSVVRALDGPSSIGQSEKTQAAGVMASESRETDGPTGEIAKAETPSAEETVYPAVIPESTDYFTSQAPYSESSTRLLAKIATTTAAATTAAVAASTPTSEASAAKSSVPDVLSTPPERLDLRNGVPDPAPPTLPPDVISRHSSAEQYYRVVTEAGAETGMEAGLSGCQSTSGDSRDAATSPTGDAPARHGPARVEISPTETSSTPTLTSPDVTRVTQEVTGGGRVSEPPGEPPSTAETRVPPTPAGDLSSVLDRVRAAPSPPVTCPTTTSSAATAESIPKPAETAVNTAPGGENTTVTGSETPPVSQSQEPGEPVQEQEPVRFQSADVSDSELETYLDQLEGDSATLDVTSSELVPNEPTAGRESFGGARPKTSPAAAVEMEPPPPPPSAQPPSPPDAAGASLQPLKGGVISRLQSQVSIECEVDSRSADTGPGSPPPAVPVRPSSLHLPARSQTIAGQTQATDDAAPTRTTAPPSSPGDTRPPPAPPRQPPGDEDDPASSAQESVSTTGGNIVTAPGAYEEARLAAGRTPAAPPAASPAAAGSVRGQLVSLSDEDKNLGKVAPVWVPDEDAAACMECELRFTVIRRRHHCRACGRLLCSACCSERVSLDYMEFREGRVCSRCKRTIDRVQQESRVVSAGGSPGPHHQMARPPNPNNPMEYCSTVPPTEQASHNAPPPTVMVPTGVLKRTENSGGRTPSREAKQVMFSDGIRPGGDLTEPSRPRPSSGDPELRRPPHRRTARLARGADRSPAAILKDAKGCKDLSWKPESGKLPPIYQSGSAGASVKQSTPEETIVSMIRAERDLPWSFLINKNLMVVVKMFKLDCCVGRTCWIFTSHGLSTVGQEEVVVILETLPEEATLPKDIFSFYHHLFAEAAKGHFVTELGNTLFSAPFLGSKDHGGFLYLRPTFQCLHNVPTPPQPFLVAVLIQKWEAPWAKVFPLRLLLRLGAEFRYYPCPLVSVRHRKPVFYEVGHTIINLLADFRNFAYVLPTVHGMHIHMEEQETSVLIPRNRFNQVLKAINNSNDHVLALGASFSREADSHLVCMQNEDGQYQTQAINIQNRPRQVTGASFVVFNGALKSAAGVTAKSSIVEDGLMFQISSETMQTLRGNLRQMQDYKIECGPVGQPPDELINIRWVEDDRSHNLGVRSVIDDKPLDGIPSIRVHSGTDYVGDSKLIRWTEVYLIKVTESVARSSSEPPDFSRLAEEVARGTCVALTPHLPLLADSERTRIGLRATVDSDTVGYEAGSNGEPLPPSCMNLLDSELVPVLHRYAAEVPDSPSCLELLFHVIDR